MQIIVLYFETQLFLTHKQWQFKSNEILPQKGTQLISWQSLQAINDKIYESVAILII